MKKLSLALLMMVCSLVLFANPIVIPNGIYRYQPPRGSSNYTLHISNGTARFYDGNTPQSDLMVYKFDTSDKVLRMYWAKSSRNGEQVGDFVQAWDASLQYVNGAPALYLKNYSNGGWDMYKRGY